MVKTSVSTRVLSVALSAALCCTVVPAEGLAFADETNATTEQSAQASADEAAAAQANDVVEAPADDAPAAPVDRVSEDVQVSAPEAPASEAAADEAASEGAPEVAADIEITRTSVNLASDATTVFSYNGLVFQVSEDGDTAACVGWTGTAPEGELQIPAQAVAAGKVYPVVRIMSGGGFIARRG